MADQTDTPSSDSTLASARSLAYVESAVVEDDVLTAARERARDLGVQSVSPAAGQMLGLFTQLLNAKTVVEVGTGAGISGLWLLDGMRGAGTLTTIDAEPEYQRAARQAFQAGGIATSRTRLINGNALDVLPKLADGGYDLVFIDSNPLDYPQYVEQGVRLLRSGGIIVLHNALLGNAVADPAHNDEATLAVRAATRTIAENEQLTKLIIPVGDGLLAAVSE